MRAVPLNRPGKLVSVQHRSQRCKVLQVFFFIFILEISASQMGAHLEVHAVLKWTRPLTNTKKSVPDNCAYLMGITVRTYSSRPRSDTSSSLMKYNKGVHHLPVSFFFKGLHCKSANFNLHWRKILPVSLRENSKIT